MAQSKYIVFKQADAQKHLTPAQKQSLMDILRAVAEGRRQEQKSVGDVFFVLNMKDKYALTALDAYVRDVQYDGIAHQNAEVQAALDTALAVKQTAALNLQPGLPT